MFDEEGLWERSLSTQETGPMTHGFIAILCGPGCFSGVQGLTSISLSIRAHDEAHYWPPLQSSQEPMLEQCCLPYSNEAKTKEQVGLIGNLSASSPLS